MGCLRCGKETGEKAVFCDTCKGCMDDYPIKPGTVVVIPERAPVQPEKVKRKAKKTEKKTEKKSSKKAGKKPAKKLTPTERDNKQLRLLARILFATSVLLLGAVCCLAYMLFMR